MEEFDFDRVIDRRGSGALKCDALGERYGNPDLLPLWVADMDFATPRCVTDALRKMLDDNPVLGYMCGSAEWRRAVIDWQASHHGQVIRPEELSYIPGVVKGIGMAINALTAEGEGVIIQPPVYHIFSHVIRGNRRRVVDNPLRLGPDGRYEMDFEGLERLASDSATRLLILSNPHNPGGRVWPAETLRRVAEVCHRHGVTVISDEIHADMTLWGNRHTPFATVSPEAAEVSITLGAPSKVFNMPGIVSAWSVVPNDTLRRRFYSWLQANEFDEAATPSVTATIAAYRHGEPWRQAMLRYVEENIRLVERECAESLPGIVPLRPEASFLVWLDCRGLGVSHSKLVELFEKRAGLALNQGEMFGPGGTGFMRMNVAAPRSIIAEALRRLRRAL